MGVRSWKPFWRKEFWFFVDVLSDLCRIFVLDKDSTISKQARQPREELFQTGQERVHIVGLAIAFPRANMTEDERSNQVDRIALRGVPHEPQHDAE